MHNQEIEKIYIYYHRFDRSMSSYILTNAGLTQYFKDIGSVRTVEALTIYQEKVYGKPRMKEYPELFHNVSHSGGWWVCAYGNVEAGLDLQKEDDRNHEKVAKRYFHPLETAWLQHKDPKEFFRLWAYNESYVKYVGDGLSRGLSCFSTVNDEKTDISGVSGFCQQEIPFLEENYYLVLTTERPVEIILKALPHQIHFLEYRVKESDKDREVLSVLREEMHLTTRKIRAVKKEEKGILLDGERVTVRRRLTVGQQLKVMLDDVEEESHIASTPMPLKILYEDMDLIFVEKPAGMVSHPSLGHAFDSLANGVKDYLEKRGEQCGIHLIGRLDKDTSGVLGIAKNSVTKDRMIRMRQDGLIRKNYVALVEGHLSSEEGDIDLPMEEYRDPDDGQKLKMRTPVLSEGLSAKTHYKVISESGDCSVVSLTLETGRMHQIRFHMAAIGHPLLGDSIYGHGPDRKRGIITAALHAAQVSFPHPYHGKNIVVSSEIPDFFC